MNFSPLVKNREVVASISPALSYQSNENFPTWQKSAREKLALLLGISEMKPCEANLVIESETECCDYKEYVFAIDSEIEYRFTSTLRIPKAAEGKMPLAIFPVGSSEDLEAALADGDGEYNYAKRAIKEGYAALVVEMRNFNECRALVNVIPEEARTRTSWCACYRSTMRAIMLSRTTIGERVWDIMRAIDAVLSTFDAIDDSKICVIGRNGGATVAYYAAAIDERIALCASSSGVSSWDKSIMAKHQCICNFVPNIVNYFSMGDIAGLIAPRAFVMTTSAADEYLTMDGAHEAYEVAKKLYASAGVPDKCACIDTDLLGFAASEIWSAVNTLI